MKTGIQPAQTVGEAITLLIQKYLYVVEKPCPNCSGEMFAWREAEGQEPRCAPVCMACGYASKLKSDAVSTEAIYQASLKQKALQYFRGSLVGNKDMLKRTFDDYHAKNAEGLQAKQTAMKFCENVLKGEQPHFIMTGNVGAGKTHLAMASLNEIMTKSNYDKRVLAISYSELLESLKFAMGNDAARKQLMANLMQDIKTADVLLLDDLGAELGHENNRVSATDWNIKTVTEILDARASKATIFTTNLTGKQVGTAYGKRVISRLLQGSDGYVAAFNETKDHRATA